MGEVKLLEDMYYIMDNNQNYYRLDSEGQLIVALTKDQAGVFDAYEVRDKIGDGRKSAFYKAVSVHGTRVIASSMIENVIDHAAERVTSPLTETEYDITRIDWLEYLRHFCYLTSSAANYLDALQKQLSEVDLEICDILHYIELYDVREDEESRLVELLKEARYRRRQIKDNIEGIKHFQESIGNNANLLKAQKSAKQLETLDRRTYAPRRLHELFKDGTKLKSTKKEELEIQEMINAEPIKAERRVVQMSDVRRDTIFDTKQMDWLQFARGQLEFFKNAEQHISNLQIDLADIDDEIENTLFQIENANFNAVQGYMVFKKLRELRNSRKAKLRELEMVSVLVEPFNCEAMMEQYEENLQMLEEIMEEQMEKMAEDAVG